VNQLVVEAGLAAAVLSTLPFQRGAGGDPRRQIMLQSINV
jgi:hypothetical protein